MSLLLDEILGEEKCESAIVGGVQLLLALLDVNKIRLVARLRRFSSKM